MLSVIISHCFTFGEKKKLVKHLRVSKYYETDYSISPYSVRILENAGKMQTRITPNTETFYAVESRSKIVNKLSKVVR